MADNEQESTNQKVSKILLTIVLLLLIIVILVGIFFGGKVINKAKLDNEIKEVASKNIESDDFSNIQVASSGEYAIVERAIKEFYRDYANYKKEFVNKLNDEKIKNMLTVENYKTDGPEFTSSLEYIKSAQEEFNKVSDELLQVLTPENIMARIKNKKLSEYYQKLYKNYFFTGDNLVENLQESYQDVEDSKKLMNNVYNNETKILNFLVENKASWEVLNEKLTFDSEELSNEYNTLKSNLYAE